MNMRKKGFIAGALALCMVLGGTGYAYWTDALHITTSATTANLDVEFVDVGYYAQYDDESKLDGKVGWAITDGTKDGTVFANIIQGNSGNNVNDPGNISYNSNAATDSAYGMNLVEFTTGLVGDGTLKHGVPTSKYNTTTKASKNISITTEKIFPGYAQVFRTDIVNDGEIGAKLEDIVTTVEGENLTDKLYNEIGIALYMCTEIASDVDIFGLASCFDESEKFTIGGVDFVRLSALTNRDNDANAQKLSEKISSKILEVSAVRGERMDCFYAIGMDPDKAGNNTTGTVELMKGGKADIDYLTENSGLKVTLDFYWAQYNNPGDKDFELTPGRIAKGNGNNSITNETTPTPTATTSDRDPWGWLFGR